VTAQLAFDLGHRPALGADDFLVAPCNQDAVAWVDRWPEWPAPALTIHGPKACGKTHLANVWRSRANARFIAVAELTSLSPYDLLGDSNACVVDDVESGFDEAALFHLYNAARDMGGHILLTAETSPSAWPLTLNDLRSRLVAAPAVAVGSPDDSVLGAVLVKLFADRQLRVEPEILSYILVRMERSFAAAESIVAALDKAALAARRAITIPLARDVLSQLHTDT
jgi:DnaA regulatory inactivator Hda